MNAINKTTFGLDGDRVSLNVPLSKVDAERRIVSGYATLSNLDSQGDIVTLAASREAFKNFKGNIRQQHDHNLPIGKMLSFREVEVVDPETGETYEGIYVDAYISKAAEAAWTMITEGVLRSFSIGGNAIETNQVFKKSADGGEGRYVREISKFNLTELSIVDSGANSLCDVVSIQKVNGETFVTGMTMTQEDFEFRNEVAPVQDYSEVIKALQVTQDLINKVITTSTIKPHEGDNELADEAKHGKVNENLTVNNATDKETMDNEIVEAIQTEPDVDVIEVVKTGDSLASDEASEEVKDDKNDEEDTDVKKMISDLGEDIKKAITDTVAESNKSVEEIRGELVKVSTTLDEKISAIEKKLADVTENLAGIEKSYKSVEKRIDGVESSTAIRKSSERGSSEEETLEKSSDTTKSVWGGKFLSL